MVCFDEGEKRDDLMRLIAALFVAWAGTAQAEDRAPPVLTQFLADFTDSNDPYLKQWRVDDGFAIGNGVDPEFRKTQITYADARCSFN